MAIVDKNLLTKGLRGQLGKTLVFRKVGDRTIVATSPSTGANPTEQQKTHRERFQRAVAAARTSMSNPTAKSRYEHEAKRKGQPNAYNVAIADFFRAPEIKDIDLAGYQAVEGNKINIIVTDNVLVSDVRIEIIKPDGTPVESGVAVQQGDGSLWVYTAKMTNPDFPGGKLTVKAYDFAGNVAIQEREI